MLSLSPLTVLDAAPPEQVAAAAAAGFEAVGIRVWPAADERVWPMLGRLLDRFAAVCEAAAERGIRPGLEAPVAVLTGASAAERAHRAFAAATRALAERGHRPS